MLNVLITKQTNKSKVIQGNFWRCWLGLLSCGDGISGVFFCPKSSNCTHEVCATLCISIMPQ